MTFDLHIRERSRSSGSFALAFGAGILMAWPAVANGGVSCNVTEGPVRLSIGTAIGRAGGAFVQGGAELRFTHKEVAADFRHVRFALPHLVHRWIDRGELKLGFYKERAAAGPHGYVSLKVETGSDSEDEGIYRGRYRVQVYDVGRGAEPVVVTHEGEVACQVE